MNISSVLPSYSFNKETGWRIDLPNQIEAGTRVLCLYRVSTAKQLYHDSNDEADIPMQRVRCREYAESRGWTVVCELQEEGISGHKVRAENRDKIQMIKDYALKGKFDILLVFMFDRIGRIADETPFVVEWLVNHGIRVWSAEEGEQRIDSHTDRLLNYIRFWQADGESQKTSIRTANSLHILTEQGYYTGGTCPYGYKLVKSGRMNKRKQAVHDLAICEEEAVVLRYIFSLASVNGCGAQSIANQLNNQGYRNRSGNNWHPATIHSILQNILYIGILKSGDTNSPVQEALRIIDDKTFYRVQEMLAVRSKKYKDVRSAPLSTRGASLLSGNVFCGHCGARLCITTSGKGRPRADGTDVKRVRYCCQTKTRKHGNCDGQTGYTVHKVDDVINNIVRDVFSKVRNINRTEIVNLINKNDLLSRQKHVSEVRHQYYSAQEELKVLQAEIVKTLTGESVYTQEMLKSAIVAHENKCKELYNELAEAESKVHDCESNVSSMEDKLDELLQWADIYDNADMSAKKMIVSRMIDRVDVFRGYEIKVTMNIGVKQFLSTLENGGV